ncbi:MAG: GyrI-like domain-containing protein, partial [Bryobacteraceae bacterium]
ILQSVNEIISAERSARRIMESGSFAVEERAIAPLLVAGIRMKGRYKDCSDGFSRLGKAVGRYTCGKALCLYYDGEYREDDANFEPCLPVRKEITTEGVSIKTLPGARCLTLIHRGPYDQLGRSYAKILKEAAARQSKLTLPSREVYIKGPGMIFKGSPSNYLTEIQLPVEG